MKKIMFMRRVPPKRFATTTYITERDVLGGRCTLIATQCVSSSTTFLGAPLTHPKIVQAKKITLKSAWRRTSWNLCLPSLLGWGGVLAPLTSTHRKALRSKTTTSKRSTTTLTHASYAQQMHVYVYLTEGYDEILATRGLLD